MSQQRRESWKNSKQVSKESAYYSMNSLTSNEKHDKQKEASQESSSQKSATTPLATDLPELPEAISFDEIVQIFLPYSNFNIKNIKRIIDPTRWFKNNKLNCAKLAQINGLFFGIFYVQNDTTILWSKFEKERDESYLILNGSCAIQVGNNVGKYKQGDYVNIFAKDIHSITTGRKEEVVIGYVLDIGSVPLVPSTLNDLKYWEFWPEERNVDDIPFFVLKQD